MSERATYTTREGYLMAWDPAQCRYRPAHVLVWEEANRRPVHPGWHVHHKDLDRHNNGAENLEELHPMSHRRLHAGWHLDNGRWWKRCGGACGELKPLDEFYSRGNGQAYSYCKPCHATINHANEASARARKREQRATTTSAAMATAPFSLPLY
jgi:hypothetical protein